MNTPELKPCPFCGSKAMVDSMYRHGKETLYQVTCSWEGCQLQPMTEWYKDKGVVERAWNRRASDADAT